MLKLFSQEFIQFQKGYSPLAKQMIDLFAEGNKLRDDTVGTIVVKMTTVLKWFQKEGGVKLAKIISDYLGVKIDKIKISKDCDFGYAVQMKIGDPYGLNAAMILDRISGRPVNTYYESIISTYKLYKPTYEELKRVSESYNAKTGHFDDVKLANGKDITATLYFDPYSAFMLKDVCHEKLGYLLPEEVAAIMIHECGHVVSCLLKAVDLWFVSTAQNSALQQFMKSASVEEQVKYLRVVSGKGQNGPVVTKALDLIDKIIGTNKESSGHTALWPLIFMLLICCFILVGSPITFAVDNIDLLFDQIINYKADKLSDMYSTTKNIKYSEQLADSYAVRHGLGSYLNSALTKAESIPMFSGISSRKSSLVWYCSKLMMIFASLIMRDYTMYDEHEKLVDRQRSIANDTLKVFKTMDLSDELKAFYIDEYERQLEWISKVPTSTRVINKIQAARAFLDYVLTIPFNMLIGGRFNNEYNKLFRQVESMMGNDLAYRAAKLDMLSNK